ncbi:MAG: ABC transporter permease subunit [Chloroflexi bacterium]|nr:ABC transporter permease subunit [Chloroflexota bacterium]
MDISVQARLDNLLWSAATVLFIIVGSVGIGYLARMIARARGLSASEQRKIYWGFMFASPWIIGFVIFVVGPALASLYYSVTDYRLGKDLHYIGLDNYRTLLLGTGAQGRRFASAMFNSFYYMAVGVPLQIITSLVMAILLNQNLRGMRFFRLIFYMPVILAGGPAILLAWRYMLASNGGFINLTLQGAAHNFFLFDWIYRGFIFAVEAFNSFYSGVATGDSIGPFKYAIPAALGFLILVGFVRGQWDEGRKGRAQTAAEIIGGALLVILAARALIADPLDASLIYGISVVASIGAIIALMQQNTRLERLWEIAPLVVGGITLIGLAANNNPDLGMYFPAVLIGAVPLVLGLVLRSDRMKRIALLVGALVLALVIVVRLVPGQLDGGRLSLVPQYLTVQSAIAQPDNVDYLNKDFATTTPAALWLYGAVVLVLGGLVLANNRYPRAQKYVIYGGTLIFGLIALSALVDGVRYFHAFDVIAATNGSPNYHFALFNGATAAFPDQTRVPLWMTSQLWTKPALVLITMWSSGAGMLIFLAALKGVPKQLYESADVDGANPWQKFWKITLPMISPALFYNIVIGVIAALQTFETVYILQTDSTVDSIASAAFFLFTRTFRQLEIGQGAAVSWILAVIIVLATIMQFRYSRWVHYEA